MENDQTNQTDDQQADTTATSATKEDIAELRRLFTDPDTIRKFYEQGRDLAGDNFSAIEEDDDDADDGIDLSGLDEDVEAISTGDKAAGKRMLERVTRAATAAADKKLKVAKQEMDQRQQAERTLASFRSKHPDLDDYEDVMWAIARRRPDLDKPGETGLALLYDAAKKKVDEIAKKRGGEAKELANRVASEKPKGSAGPKAAPDADKSEDDLMAEARAEWGGFSGMKEPEG